MTANFHTKPRSVKRMFQRWNGYGVLVLLLGASFMGASNPVHAQSPPNFTHIDNVNAAGNATLYWDVFSPVGAEEFVQNEVKVYDMDLNPLGTQWHLISSEIVKGN